MGETSYDGIIFFLMFIRNFNTATFWRTVLLCMLVLFAFSFTTAIAAEQSQRGYKGEISKKALIAELKKVQGKDDQYVEGYVINGSDIIDIIRETKLSIQIRYAVINNGLDFHRLESTDIDKAITDEKEPTRKKRLEKMKGEKINQIFHVISIILIQDSDIHSFKNGGGKISVQAKATVFTNSLSCPACSFSERTVCSFRRFP